MADAPLVGLQPQRARSERRDAWWTEVIPVVALLSAFGVYATWRAFEGAFYWTAPYLSPFYSPLIDPNHVVWPWSPALIILGGPLSFRITCYYYRKAYYRAFFFDPPSCAVGEGRAHKYKGETAFPFILQNLHRYAFYLALIFLAFLWHDVIVAFDFNGHFGVGLGTLIMLANVILLTGYSFGCHSLRHLAGGRLDCFSCSAGARARGKAWRRLSALNEHHMLWAWTSLISVGFTDFYIRLCATGAIHDLRLL